MKFFETLSIINIIIGRNLGETVFGSSDQFRKISSTCPNTLLLSGEEIAALQERFLQKEQPLTGTIEKFLDIADSFLASAPFSVYEKAAPGPSGDISDYYSQARYWWPDTSDENGIQYCNRDGETNPAIYSDNFDLQRFEKNTYRIFVLSLAYALSLNEKYAKSCATHIRHWFLNADTCQTPHFKYAQSIPGNERLRSVGIIEAHRLIYVIEAVNLIRNSENWDDLSDQTLKKWFSDLLDWMRNSDIGMDCYNKQNNIGTWYDVQCVFYAFFTEQSELAHSILKDSLIHRLSEQIDAEGKFPAELERKNPYEYFVFNLLAFLTLDNLAKKKEAAIWSTDLPDGRNLDMAIEWLSSSLRSSELSMALDYSALQSVKEISGNSKSDNVCTIYSKDLPNDPGVLKELIFFLKNELVDLKSNHKKIYAERTQLINAHQNREKNFRQTLQEYREKTANAEASSAKVFEVLSQNHDYKSEIDELRKQLSIIQQQSDSRLDEINKITKQLVACKAGLKRVTYFYNKSISHRKGFEYIEEKNNNSKHHYLEKYHLKRRQFKHYIINLALKSSNDIKRIFK